MSAPTTNIIGAKSNGSGCGGSIVISTTLGTASSGVQNAAASGLIVEGCNQRVVAETLFNSAGVAFASLPVLVPGDIVYIKDGKSSNCGDFACTTWGTTITGGSGALNLLAWYNGTNLTLIGK